MPASRVSDASIGSGSGGSVAPSPPESLTRKKSKSGRLKKLGGSLRRKLSNIGGKKKGGNSSKEKGGSGSDVCGGGETAVSHQELATSQQHHTAAAAEAAAATVQKPIVRSVKITNKTAPCCHLFHARTLAGCSTPLVNVVRGTPPMSFQSLQRATSAIYADELLMTSSLSVFQ